MKKVLVFIIVLLLAVIAYLLFWHEKSKGDTAGVHRDKCEDLHCKSYAGTGFTGMIDISVAQQMAAAYRADAGKKFIGSGPATQTEDALYTWFDLETLKRFIWNIEDTVCKSNCNKPLKLGIKLYFAKYPSAAAMSGIPDLSTVDPTYEYHHTLFMVPTFDVGSGATAKHVDFDPWHAGPDKCNPTPLRKWFEEQYQPQQRQKGEKQRVLMLGMAPSISGDEQNHGDMAPPPAGSGVFPEDQ